MILLVNIDVPDIPSAVVFYTAAFGLNAARRFGDDGVELLGASVPIYLLRKPPGSVGLATSPRDYDRHWSPVHYDVVVDDIDRALARAISAGAVNEGDVRNAVCAGSCNWPILLPRAGAWCSFSAAAMTR